MKLEGFKEIIILAEGDVKEGDFITTGLRDVAHGWLNLKETRWIESKPTLKHRDGHMIYLAKVANTTNPVVFREVTQDDEGKDIYQKEKLSDIIRPDKKIINLRQ